MIASFLVIMPTRSAQRPVPAAERLAEMLVVRHRLSTEKVAAENASRLLDDAMLQRLSRVAASGGSPLISTCSTSAWSRSLRPMPRSLIATAALVHAGRRAGAGLHGDRAVARTRPHKPQTRSREGFAFWAVMRTFSRCSTWR
jgi:hypothetical protein